MPEEVFPIVFFIMVFLFVLLVIRLNQRHKYRMRRLELNAGVTNDNDVREEIDQLQEEVAQLKRTLAQQQRALEKSGMRIDLTPYEREQLKLDQDDKFSF